MKIQVNAKEFKYISDNSKECDEKTAFLITKSSGKYIKEAGEFGAKISLTPYDLKDFLNLNIKIIGVTGTNGKTTTTALIYSLLLDLGYKVALLGTRGFFVNDELIKEKSLTTPALIEIYANIDFASKQNCDFFVMEVSSHAIEQERIEGLEFALKIHTNITQDHLDYHKTLQNYIDVKNSFFEDESPKLLNKDDKNIQFNFKNAYTYSIESASVFKIMAYSLNDGISAVIKAFEENETFYSNLYGLFNLYNLCAGISAVKILTNKPLKEICEVVENFAGVSGRMEIVSEKPLIIVDFAHTPDGMKQVLDSFKNQNLIVVFGAGGDRDRSKRALMGKVAEIFAKKIIITSDNSRSENPKEIMQEILSGIKESQKVTLIEDRKEAIKLAMQIQDKNDVLLILGKGDEEYQIIGDKKLHFSDKEVVKELLEVIGG